MSTRQLTFRDLFSWPTNNEPSTPRRARLAEPADEDAVYRQRLLGRRVRLLRLLPESTPNSLHYALDEYGLDSKLSFQALSYSWGDPTQTLSITCNGKEVQVAKNLYKALQQFQEDGNPSLLWVDALCINQANLDEKTEQVRMMADIYKTASEVVVWLGTERPGDRNGVELLRLLLERLGLPKFGKDLAPDATFYLEKYGLPDGGDPRWLDLLRIFKRQWFLRAWTVQEFLFAKRSHIRIGQLRLSWDHLFSVLLNTIRYGPLNTTVYGPRIANRELTNIRALWYLKVSYEPFLWAGARTSSREQMSLMSALAQSSLLFTTTTFVKLLGYIAKVHMPGWANSKPGLHEVLLSTSGHETTHHQDKVFAVLALTHDGRVDKIDYRKGIAEVLKDAAKMSLGVEDGDPEIPMGATLKFLLAIEAPSIIPGVPSWVPDYNSHGDFSCMLETGVGTVSWREPSLNNVAGACDGNYLHLRGRLVDVVSTIYQNDAHEFRLANATALGKTISGREIAEVFTTRPEIPYTMLQFEEECWNIAKNLGSYPTGEPVRDAYWHTLICEMPPLDAPISIMKQRFEAYHDSLPLLVTMPYILAELHGLPIQVSSNSDHGRNENVASTEEGQDSNTIGAEAAGFPLAMKTLTQSHLKDTPIAQHEEKDHSPQNTSKNTPVAIESTNSDSTIHANIADVVPELDPIIKPLSRAPTLQDITSEIAETVAEGSPGQYSHLITAPATPELFISAGLRVPKCVYLHPERTILQHMETLSADVDKFEQKMHSLTNRRRFGTTNGGYLGWFPLVARPGDAIAVFNGSTIPIVLRRSDIYQKTYGKEAWDGTWKVMGACYVRGFMNAAAYSLVKEEVVISLS